MDDRRADAGGCPRDLARPFRLEAQEALLAALLQDAHEVHHHVGALHRPDDRVGIAQVRLHGDDLPDLAQRLKEEGEVRAADGDAHAIAALGERPHHVASEEAGSAEDGDQLR